jgi:P-type E1-E2 ATPase
LKNYGNCTQQSHGYKNGAEKEIPVDDVVPGDIVMLNAGDIIPADSYIIESNDLHVNESVLTGESFPSEKFAGSARQIYHCPKSQMRYLKEPVLSMAQQQCLQLIPAMKAC